MPRPQLNLAGRRFGRLQVLRQSVAKDNGELVKGVWHCLCDCGKEIDVLGLSLRSGNTKSCGCLRRERAGRPAVKTTAQTGRFEPFIPIKEIVLFEAKVDDHDNHYPDGSPKQKKVSVSDALDVLREMLVDRGVHFEGSTWAYDGRRFETKTKAHAVLEAALKSIQPPGFKSRREKVAEASKRYRRRMRNALAALREKQEEEQRHKELGAEWDESAELDKLL